MSRRTSSVIQSHKLYSCSVPKDRQAAAPRYTRPAIDACKLDFGRRVQEYAALPISTEADKDCQMTYMWNFNRFGRQ